MGLDNQPLSTVYSTFCSKNARFSAALKIRPAILATVSLRGRRDVSRSVVRDGNDGVARPDI